MPTEFVDTEMQTNISLMERRFGDIFESQKSVDFFALDIDQLKMENTELKQRIKVMKREAREEEEMLGDDDDEIKTDDLAPDTETEEEAQDNPDENDADNNA